MKYFFQLSSAAAIAGLLCFANTASAQNGTMPFEKLEAGWHQKAIPVSDWRAPLITRLTTAFCETWQTSICHSVARYLRNPRRYSSTYSRNHEIGYSVDVDEKNGFLNATDEYEYSPYLYATVWQRTNGHTLLGIHTGKPVDPDIDIVLFYDYDPGTEKLTPEKRISDYLTSKKYGQVEMTWVELPRKGKDVHVSAYGGEPAIEYTFKFNGMDFDEPIILKCHEDEGACH